jgi:hypothetical protein
MKLTEVEVDIVRKANEDLATHFVKAAAMHRAMAEKHGEHAAFCREKEAAAGYEAQAYLGKAADFHESMKGCHEAAAEHSTEMSGKCMKVAKLLE